MHYQLNWLSCDSVKNSAIQNLSFLFGSIWPYFPLKKNWVFFFFQGLICGPSLLLSPLLLWCVTAHMKKYITKNILYFLALSFLIFYFLPIECVFGLTVSLAELGCAGVILEKARASTKLRFHRVFVKLTMKYWICQFFLLLH